MRTMFVFLLVVALGIPACKTAPPEYTPAQEWAAAASAFKNASKVLTQLRRAGKINDEEKALLVQWGQKAKDALDEMEDALDLDDVSGFDLAYIAFTNAVTVLENATRGEMPKGPPPEEGEVP